MIGLFAGLFAASFLVTTLLTPLLMRLARRVGFLDHPGPRKIHTEPIPYGGGLAVAAGVLLSVAGLALARPAPAPSTLEKAIPVTVYAMGSLAILVLGLIDDRRKLSAPFKLLVETIVATGVAVGGARLRLFEAPPAVSIAVTVLWILAVTNAFNLLDHMDGLSSGVALLSGAAFLIVAVQTGQTAIGSLLVALLGACAAFLLFNFPPARIFLGDAGSLFVGFWLSCLTVSFTFYEAHYVLYTYFVPVAVLAVPLFDTASVVLIRLRRRKPIFEGDTNHLAHRLVALGMSRRQAVLTIYALTLFAGISAILLYRVRETRDAVFILAQLLLIFAIITILEVAGRAAHE